LVLVSDISCRHRDDVAETFANGHLGTDVLYSTGHRERNHDIPSSIKWTVSNAAFQYIPSHFRYVCHPEERHGRTLHLYKGDTGLSIRICGPFFGRLSFVLKCTKGKQLFLLMGYDCVI
jgi:hypothetical protein